MSELLSALVAASKAGFNAPKCARCEGKGSRFGRYRFPSYRQDDPLVWENQDCHECHATGLDASDPERVGFRALMWLSAKDELRIVPGMQLVGPAVTRSPIIHFRDEYDALSASATHDGTPTGLATAMLRLVARVGGGQ